MVKNNFRPCYLTALIFLAILLVSMPGCHQVPIHREITRTEKLAHTVTNEILEYHSPDPLPQLEMMLTTGLSRNEAIRVALLNNRALKAAFQDLGIAKADLIQAGLFKNPTLSTAVHIPKENEGIVTNIEVKTTILSLSDLWQIPLRKRVFSAQLEQVLMNLVNQILQTMATARHAYDEVLFAKALLANTEDMLIQAIKLRDNLHHRHQFGLENDADVYLAEASVGYWQMKVIELKAAGYRAQTHLSYILGVEPTPDTCFSLTETFSIPPQVPDIEYLLRWALIHHPEIQLAHKKITYYKSLLRYEHSRRIKTADLGVVFKQDFERMQRGVGPYFAMEVPLFDTNQVRIAHVEYSLKRAEQELSDTCLKVKTDICSYYQTLAALQINLANYEKAILEYHKKALDYSITHQKVMQITIPTVIHMQRDLYEAQRNLLHVRHTALDTYTDLEKSSGQEINKPHNITF